MRLWWVVVVALCLFAAAAIEQDCPANDNDEESLVYVTDGCSLIMANSNVSGWGVFTLVDRARRGTPLLDGDIVIQVPDVMKPQGAKYFLDHYWWDSSETGGFMEGQQVSSILPGFGMLANGDAARSNTLPWGPTQDDGNCRRETSPGAGAFTHYHNHTWFVRRPMEAGDEILVHFGDGWFAERNLTMTTNHPYKPPTWLKENGICLDHIRPGLSKIKDAGRGAFARRKLVRNTVVAPLPVVPIFHKHDTLRLQKLKDGKNDVVEETWQLLLNYCFGHANSSMALFPYSPMVNLINHDATNPNVRLTWSQHPTLFRGKKWLEMSPHQLEKDMDTSGLLLELVATRDIASGEEILMDYGPEWQEAWDHHVAKPPPVLPQYGGNMYTPGHVLDEVVFKVRTHEEQERFPYPDNVVTSCFYEYKPPKKLSQRKGAVATIRWAMTRTVFEWKNLRPCSIIQRSQDERFYTVRIRNRPGLKLSERIPRGDTHIVSNVPRTAIRFSNKLYTTDQHLPHAFRQMIAIPDDMFPEPWKDLITS